MMNRRKLFGVLAGAPAGIAAAVSAHRHLIPKRPICYCVRRYGGRWFPDPGHRRTVWVKWFPSSKLEEMAI